MDLSEIETFLTIVNTKSITKTADILFLSQPTVSHRLKSLEKELGFPLIVRKKGFKNVELTSKGSEFVSIAERYISLWKETQVLAQDRDSTLLSIGCTDSLNIALFAGFYRQMEASGCPIDLDIHTHQSSELYSILDRHDIDIGFIRAHLSGTPVSGAVRRTRHTQITDPHRRTGPIPGIISELGCQLPDLARPMADRILQAADNRRYHHPPQSCVDG